MYSNEKDQGMQHCTVSDIWIQRWTPWKPDGNKYAGSQFEGIVLQSKEDTTPRTVQGLA